MEVWPIALLDSVKFVKLVIPALVFPTTGRHHGIFTERSIHGTNDTLCPKFKCTGIHWSRTFSWKEGSHPINLLAKQQWPHCALLLLFLFLTWRLCIIFYSRAKSGNSQLEGAPPFPSQWHPSIANSNTLLGAATTMFPFQQKDAFIAAALTPMNLLRLAF